VERSLRFACGAVDEDGKPIEFMVRIQANHISEVSSKAGGREYGD
jgi:hypothetical protein